MIPAPQPVACGPRRDSALPSPTAVPPRPGVAAPIGGSRQRVVSTSRGWSASAVAFVAPSRTVARLAVGALRANVTSKLLSDAGLNPFGTLDFRYRRCTDASSRHNDSCPQFRIRFDIRARRDRGSADRPAAARARAPGARRAHAAPRTRRGPYGAARIGTAVPVSRRPRGYYWLRSRASPRTCCKPGLKDTPTCNTPPPDPAEDGTRPANGQARGSLQLAV